MKSLRITSILIIVVLLCGLSSCKKQNNDSGYISIVEASADSAIYIGQGLSSFLGVMADPDSIIYDNSLDDVLTCHRYIYPDGEARFFDNELTKIVIYGL
jgi:hypothetical protein